MKAMRLKDAGVAKLALENVPQPEPGAGEVLIRVHAAGVTPTELLWYPTTHTKTGEPRHDAVPGHEFSGLVAAVGEGVSGITVGQEVYGMNDWFADGATAEFCVTQPASLAGKPKKLTHGEAATIPIGALTAWQGLFDRAKLQAGERVLIHGGSGAVGIFAVQLAHSRGAHVIATASEHNLEFVSRLGADEVIDHKTQRFEERAGKVDVVFDAVGGDTVDRSWSLLKPGGRMITIAADAESTSDERVKQAFFIVEPNCRQLAEVAQMLDAGTLRTLVGDTVLLEEASEAYALRRKPQRGKVVVAVTK